MPPCISLGNEMFKDQFNEIYVKKRIMRGNVQLKI